MTTYEEPTWLVTGGAWIIGANFMLQQRREGHARIVNLDKLTYAGNRTSLAALEGDAGLVFVQGDIADRGRVAELLARHRPAADGTHTVVYVRRVCVAERRPT